MLLHKIDYENYPDDWRVCYLEKLAKRGSGHTPDQQHPEYWNGGIKWVSLADSSRLDAGYIHDTAKEISAAGIDNSSAVIHPAETVVISRDAGVGKSAVLASPMAVSQHFIAWECDNSERLNSWFLYYWLQFVKREIERQAVGSTIRTIGLSYFKKITIPRPSYREQERIAKILVAWDQATETTEKLIENSTVQRKALMQQLLTGNKRYSQFIESNEKQKTKYGDVPLDWSFLPISDIAWERNERAGVNSELPVLACSKYVGFVDSLRYFKKKVYSDDTSNYKIVRRGCYGFPSNHIEEGSIGYQNICDAGIVSPIYSVFETNERVHDGYLFRLLKTEHYRQIFQAYTNASVDRRGSLRWKEFSKIHVPVPSLAEQQRVAETIDTADKDLTNLKAQLLQLQAQKRGLMQQLLTGKRRVTLD